MIVDDCDKRDSLCNGPAVIPIFQFVERLKDPPGVVEDYTIGRYYMLNIIRVVVERRRVTLSVHQVIRVSDGRVEVSRVRKVSERRDHKVYKPG